MKKLFFITLCCLLFITQLKAHPGIGIVMDSKGTIFYTDLVHVWKISPEGEVTIAVKDVHTHELYIDKDDNLYGEHEWYNGEVTDTWGNYVWCLSASGELQQSIPPVEGFLANTTLVRDVKGNSYFSEKRDDFEILKVESQDGVISQFSEHHFDDIRWMHFSKNDENLYIVDKLQIKKVSPEGTVTVVAENLKEKQAPFGGVADRHYLYGLWTDTTANVYVAAYGAGKVKKITPEGTIETVYKAPLLWSPAGGLITSKGIMYILEYSKSNKARVRKIVPNGKDVLFKG